MTGVEQDQRAVPNFIGLRTASWRNPSSLDGRRVKIMAKPAGAWNHGSKETASDKGKWIDRWCVFAADGEQFAGPRLQGVPIMPGPHPFFSFSITTTQS